MLVDYMWLCILEIQKCQNRLVLCHLSIVVFSAFQLLHGNEYHVIMSLTLLQWQKSPNCG